MYCRDEGPIKFIDEDDDSGSEESGQGSSGQSSPRESSPTSLSSPSTLREGASPPTPTSPTVPSDPESNNDETIPSSSSDSSPATDETPVTGDVDVSDVDMELEVDGGSQTHAQVSFNDPEGGDSGAVDDNRTNERLEGSESGSGDTQTEEKSLEEVRAEHYHVEEDATGDVQTDGGASNSVGGSDCSNSDNSTTNTEQRTGSSDNLITESSEDKVGTEQEESAEQTSSEHEPTEVAEPSPSNSPKAEPMPDQPMTVPDSPPADASSPRRIATSPGVAVEVNEEDYYDFTFWRTPLPEVDLDLDSVKGKHGSKQRVTITPVEVQTDQSESGMEVDSLSTQFDGVRLVELGATGSQVRLNVSVPLISE